MILTGLPLIIHGVFLPASFSLATKPQYSEFPLKSLVKFFQLLVIYMLSYLILETIVAVIIQDFEAAGFVLIVPALLLPVFGLMSWKMKKARDLIVVDTPIHVRGTFKTLFLPLSIFFCFVAIDFILIMARPSIWLVLSLIVHFVFLPYLFVLAFKQWHRQDTTQGPIHFKKPLIVYTIAYMIIQSIQDITNHYFVLIGLILPLWIATIIAIIVSMQPSRRARIIF